MVLIPTFGQHEIVRERWGLTCVVRMLTFIPPIRTEPSRPRRVYIRNSVELARYGNELGCRSYEAAASAIPGLSRD